jgi:3-deoxy-7-phosphoheptulonate synthase
MDDLALISLKNADFKHTVVTVGAHQIGQDLTIIAGPCAVESEAQTLAIARAVKEAGANLLRGGAFKPRTSPYSFQGLGREGLEILSKARRATGLPVVTEVLDTRHVELVDQYADMFQIGSRNMQNFELLREVGRTDKPVLLKRGMSATLEEWLSSAEYILHAGNPHVVLCERGIRTFEPSTRYTLDLSIIPALKEVTHLPVVVDPSHATGRASLVERMCLAAAAAGSDGVMIEVHTDPSEALCDNAQLLTTAELHQLAEKIRKMSRAMNDILGPAA